VVAIVPVDALHDADAKDDPREIDEFLAGFEADFTGAAETFVRERLFTTSADPNIVERVVAAVSSASPKVAISALRHAIVYDATAALREIHSPIRAINTELFPTNVPANRKYAPQFEAVIMDGVGHYPMLEEPARFNQLLERALDHILQGR
jgi:pimeloyl-ACP methyl ester carboxylesterase